MKKLLTAIALFTCMKALALDPNHFTITRITAPYFIVDGNSPSTITKAYVGFKIRNNSNSATTYNNLKFTISSIGTSVVGQNYAVVAPASGVINVGTLAPGQSKVCYYYVSYPAAVAPQGTFNVVLSDNTASSKSQGIVIRNRSAISANAGGAATQTFTNQDIIGGTVIDDVTYVVGNAQNGDENDFQVAVSTQFDPTRITLLSTQVITSSVPNITAGIIDSLYFISGNGSNGATVTIRWTFKITGYNYTNYLLPCAGSTSGSTNYKYALNTSLGAGSPITISSSANPLTITKTSDKPLYGVNAAAIFTVTIQNPGAYGVSIDKITDQLPAGFTFQSLDAASQVTPANSTSIPITGATGTLTFEGGVTSGANTSYYIAAGGTIILKYNATSAPASASNLISTAKDYIGVTEVGSAQNTVSVSSTLPVTLLSFAGNWANKKVELKWETSSEINSYKFEIERIQADQSIEKLGTVYASGNSTSINIYSFVDSFPIAGINRYRIKMIDIDGRFKYSNILSLAKDQQPGLMGAGYPNPVVNEFRLPVNSTKKQRANIRVINTEGKTILQQSQVLPAGSSVLVVDKLEKLTAGIYFLYLSTADGNLYQKIIKL